MKITGAAIPVIGVTVDRASRPYIYPHKHFADAASFPSVSIS